MKSLSIIAAAVLAAGVTAQSPSITTTITAHAGCPTGPAADVMVTRSNAPVPSCAAGNGTKPSIVTMPGYGPPAGNATATGSMAPQFTGAAGRTVVSGVLGVVAGCAVWML
ncbi:hypothetical protein C7974DRAFT_407793 [Boeremia exigua]|uniref:uncharacterized protein n=1 Tax=Boeremia exigua TaxID=749465 RepID=UPI001E8E454B|nr:uncharacterized protein C7974DRAFT_407793 [Boeremia exigua]KAH6644086.1 hypothetical protein C7974DRAFT_407793 [Boeremia exigua]